MALERNPFHAFVKLFGIIGVGAQVIGAVTGIFVIDGRVALLKGAASLVAR